MLCALQLSPCTSWKYSSGPDKSVSIHDCVVVVDSGHDYCHLVYQSWGIFMSYWILVQTKDVTLALEVMGGGARPGDNAGHCIPHVQQSHW